MATVREIYEIENYSYGVEVKESVNGQVGRVSLWKGSRRIADFGFKMPGSPHDPFLYHPEDSDDYIGGDVDSNQRDAIIDLLRNESPIRLLVWHDDTPDRVIKTVRLATATEQIEPVGEGED